VVTRRIPVLAVALAAAAVLVAPAAHAAKKSKRYGLEARLVEYDAARDVFKLEVVKTKVSGGFGTGGVAGDPAPGSIKAGATLDFQVVPEGSVLRRTVIKGSKGGGLDNSGTREGFARAVSVIPKDRPVVVSFEENPGGGAPWIVRMVLIRLSPEEIRQRLEELGIDPDEGQEAAQ
jgi:hypothetical protein